jgi:hypothetical protein
MKRVYVIVMMAFFLVIAGCPGSSLKQTFTSRPMGKKDKGPSPIYYDFADVLVPRELKVDKKASFVYQTPGFAGGVLSLKGRVEVNSLIDFFKRNMVRDNWKLISSFKAPRTIMLFHKGNRWCVINISEREFSTYAEIWVAPTIEESEEGLLR